MQEVENVIIRRDWRGRMTNKKKYMREYMRNRYNNDEEFRETMKANAIKYSKSERGKEVKVAINARFRLNHPNYNIKRQRQYRIDRKAKGICIICGKNPAREEKTTCVVCSKRNALYYLNKFKGE